MRLYLLLFILTICGSKVLVAQNSQNMLTVEETVLLAKTTYFDHIPEEAIAKTNRANPAARPFLYQILSDSTKKGNWPSVMGSFAYLGQEEDVEKLNKFLMERKGLLVRDDYSTAMMVFDVLGAMASRGIAPAKELLKSMTIPTYWTNVHFFLFVNPPANYPDFTEYMALHALQGYIYVNDPAFLSFAAGTYQQIYNSTKSTKQKETVRKLYENVLQMHKEIQQTKH